MKKCLITIVFALSALMMLNGCIVSEEKLTDRVQQAMVEYEQGQGNRLEVTDLKLEKGSVSQALVPACCLVSAN